MKLGEEVKAGNTSGNTCVGVTQSNLVSFKFNQPQMFRGV